MVLDCAVMSGYTSNRLPIAILVSYLVVCNITAYYATLTDITLYYATLTLFTEALTGDGLQKDQVLTMSVSLSPDIGMSSSKGSGFNYVCFLIS